MTNPSDRKPAAFALDDARLVVEEPPSPPVHDIDPLVTPKERGRGWGRIFLSALGGLLLMAVLLWINDTIAALIQRGDWLGWIATALFAVAAFAFVMMIAREVIGLGRLSALTALRQRAALASSTKDARVARTAVADLRGLFAGRSDIATAIRALRQHERDVLDATQILTLAERELLSPLDEQARLMIGTAGRRVAAVTSVSPSAIVDVAFVAFANVRLLRNLAVLYGGRPGFLATLRLFRMIGSHLAITGGLAITDGLMHQLIGHGITARISRRLGEGVINGSFTIRIGIAALEVLRPFPYIEAKAPRLREFLTAFLKFGSASDDSKVSSK